VVAANGFSRKKASGTVEAVLELIKQSLEAVSYIINILLASAVL
jgi:hypothetical protein